MTESLSYTYIMEREEIVLNYLREHDIPFTNYNHPEGKTIEEAKRWWKDDGSIHCKNLFFRNHKGDKHYLVCFHCDHDLDIHDLEHRLKASLVAQGLPSCGKLSFVGMNNRLWVAIDYGHILVHVFQPEVREFYSLETLWEDAKITNIQDID